MVLCGFATDLPICDTILQLCGSCSCKPPAVERKSSKHRTLPRSVDMLVSSQFIQRAGICESWPHGACLEESSTFQQAFGSSHSTLLEVSAVWHLCLQLFNP